MGLKCQAEEPVGGEEVCRETACWDISREEAGAPATSGVLTRSSLGGDEERRVGYEGCEGGSTVIVKGGEVNEIWVHSSLKWSAHSASLQPPHVPRKAGTTSSSAATSNLPWVRMRRFPN